VVHGIRATLDVHLDWVVLQVDIANAFNFISRKVIFKKLHAIGAIVLIRTFHPFLLCSLILFYFNRHFP
jgi:uncharacterized membrane protein